MRWRDRFGADTDAAVGSRALQIEGRTAAALRVAERAVRAVTNPYARASAHIDRVVALVNLGRTAQYTAAVDEAFAAIRQLSEPYPHGHLHAVAALAARQQGAPERGVTHLVHAARALGAAGDEPDADLAWGWHDLAMAYSYLGFHGYALSAIERARDIGVRAQAPPEHFAVPSIRLRMALSLDHHGDTDGCLRVLRDLSAEMRSYDLALRPSGRTAFGYALARQAALDEPPVVDPRRLLGGGVEGQRARDLRALGDVCLMIAAGKATDALTRLDAVTVSPDTFGPAEPARLRSLAFAAAGDHAAAHEADRYAFRLAAQRTDRLRDMFMEGIAARLDHEDLRAQGMRLDDREVLSDPLTGLPNRTHLDRHLAALAGRGERAMVGTVDLDGLAAVNEVHGRLSGDLVLQRVAGVLARVMRHGDLVARIGSDDFVVVLRDASPGDAADLAQRIVEAVGDEDWAALVPGTAIGVTVTWQDHPPPR